MHYTVYVQDNILSVIIIKLCTKDCTEPLSTTLSVVSCPGSCKDRKILPSQETKHGSSFTPLGPVTYMNCSLLD